MKFKREFLISIKAEAKTEFGIQMIEESISVMLNAWVLHHRKARGKSSIIKFNMIKKEC